MRRKLLSLFVVLLTLSLMVPIPSFAADTVITASSIDGVTAPVKGATPTTAITETAEYTGSVVWSGSPATFAAGTEYTATITLTPKTGYTLDGVAENFFKVVGATATNGAGSGVITVVFPSTEQENTEPKETEPEEVVPNSETSPAAIDIVTPTNKIESLDEAVVLTTDAAISIAAINGVTVPVKGAIPVTAITEATQYTGTISWNTTPTAFAADTVYTATITLTPKTGYTLAGVAKDLFTVAGATANNDAGSGVITAVFPATAPAVAPHFVGAETNSTGDTVSIKFDKAMSDPSSDAGNFTVKINGFSYYDVPVMYTVAVSSAALNADATQIDLILVQPLQRGDIVTVEYTPGNAKAADTDKLEAFGPQPVTNKIPVLINTNLTGTWQIFDHVGNWGEASYQSEIPSITDDTRGNSFNRHIVINGSTVYFFGNGIRPFKDFLYLPSSQDAAKSFTFDLDLGGIKYHSMEGGGFLFNTNISENKIYSYCVLFINDYGNYAVKLYQIDGVNVNDFHDGIGSYYNIGGGGAGITELGVYPLQTGDKHSIVLEASSTTVDMWDGTTKLIDKFTLPKEYSTGVGIIGSYQSHHCSELSYFVFSNLNIQGIADLSAVLSGNQVNLTFTAPQGASAVSVEQSTDKGVTWSRANASSINNTSTTATVSGLTAGNTYYFRLKITGGLYNGYSRIATVEYKADPVITPTPAPTPVSTPTSTPNSVKYCTLTINKTGEGTVTPGIGAFTYSLGSTVVLTATPAEGYTFEGWTGTTGSTVYIDADRKITAVFKKIGTEPTHESQQEPQTPAQETPAPGPEPEPKTPAAETPAQETPAPEAPTSTQPETRPIDKLPKTGGIPALMVLGFGGLITTTGIYLRRRK